MSIAARRVTPEEMRTSMIRIYGYEDKNPVGTFYNMYYGRVISFSNLTRLLFLMEDLMNDMDYPQAAVKNRRFERKKKDVERMSMEQRQLSYEKQTLLATFKVRVMFRRGASWQGKISWVEGQQEMAFRSALEFIQLMDSILA